MFAGNLKLNNLIVIVDRNKMSVMDYIDDDANSGNLTKKFKSCGWDVQSINGHDFNKINKAFNLAKKSKKPTAIIANTIKGKGVSFMENQLLWHYKSPDKKQYEQAIREIKSKS